MNEELMSFVASLLEDTQFKMDEYQTPEMAFTAVALDKIVELLDCTDPVIEHCKLTKSNGDTIGEIHAYAESVNGEVLYLFYTDYNPLPEVKTKSNTECQPLINRPQGFYNQAVRFAYNDVDSSSSEYRALRYIYDNVQKFNSVNIVILSNYIINNLTAKRVTVVKPLFTDTWDLKKLYANTHSMSDHMAIDIDFDSDEYKRYKIPFIQMESSQYGYKCIQAMFPAKLLFQLYERYNTNLLYNNVRYFLGLKGTKDKKPNVAMLDTLRKENEMFLAYNNGITALAKGIESFDDTEKTDVTDPDSKSFSQYISMGMLKKIMEFRIINGGQTTAVIFNAKNYSNNTTDPTKKVNLLGVYVQLKLIVSDDIEKISGNIALSSNFQNKVQYSDFTVSNEFNTKFEQLSRGILIPNANNEPTHWFYERLKGQYDEECKKRRTKQDKEYFEFCFPKKKKFSKEDVARIWSNWNQLPFDAVKGATTMYAAFMKSIVERGFIPDEDYYKKTIALLIIYRYLLSRPDNKQYANGKASVIAYAMAIMSSQTFGRFDLLKVWKKQDLSDNTKIYLNSVCDKIYTLFQERVSGLNTTLLSYGKTKPAYDYIMSQSLGVDHHLLDNDLINYDD